MKLDAHLYPHSLSEVPSLAAAAEAMAFDGIWFGETKHDSLVACTLASEHTKEVDVGTAITLAFTRSPMALAYAAWDLQSMARGRFILGLGSQVKGHMERRFSVEWVPPMPKMREVILSLRAIWSSWQKGEPLRFEGRFYRFDLMTPFFNPGPIEHPDIPIYLAAVNRGMAQMAGELCQGIHIHPLHTTRYIREVLKPAAMKGARKAGRPPEEVTFAAAVFVAIGDNPDEIRRSRKAVGQQVAFYASTRTYRAVLDLHGWGHVGDRLHRLSVEGRWDEMPREIPEEMLDGFVVEASYDDLPEALLDRYRGLVDRVSLYLPLDPQAPWWKQFVRDFKGAS